MRTGTGQAAARKSAATFVTATMDNYKRGSGQRVENTPASEETSDAERAEPVAI